MATATAAGDLRLTGDRPDGSSVEAAMHQSLVGPTEVAVLHAGEEVARVTGFVL